MAVHFEIPAPLARDNALYFGHTPPAPAAHDAGSHHSDSEGEATLRLLKTCVEAMGLLQAKVEQLDTRLRMREHRDSEMEDPAILRADLTTMRGKVEDLDTKLGIRIEGQADVTASLASKLSALQGTVADKGHRLVEAENRMARVEVCLQEFAVRHTEDVTAARTEAANWRLRTETDVMAFDQLSTRLATLEEGYIAKFETATQALADCEADNARLKTENRIVETASDRLRVHLTTLDSTIADQRARISCLQNKLATATYAIRLEHMSRAMEANGEDILDLATMTSKSLISAA